MPVQGQTLILFLEDDDVMSDRLLNQILHFGRVRIRFRQVVVAPGSLISVRVKEVSVNLDIVFFAHLGDEGSQVVA